MALLALNSFSFQVKKQEIYFSRARLGQKDRKEQVQVLAMGLGLERPDAKVPEQKFCKQSKETDWIQWKNI